jgi:hypothetical protein
MTSFHEKKRDRRDFLKNFLSDIKTSRQEARRELQKERTRASVLALKYAKNELALTRIGLESPVHVADSKFTVKITGYDQAESSCQLQLNVDCQNRQVEVPNTDTE